MRNMKKRGLALSLVVMMLLSGCSLGKAPGSIGGNGGGSAEKGTELQIGIVAKGYGDEFAKQLAAGFEEKTGIKTEVVKSNAMGDWVSGQLLAGAENNDIDIIFDIRPTAMRDIAVSNYIKGYERAYVDLSDIYNEVLEGYGIDKTLKEIVSPYALRSVTWDLEGEGYGDGKQYFVNYVTGVEGLLYNVDLFEKYNLTEPKTTTEFFALLEKIKTLESGSYAKNDDGREIYPYVYSGKVDYTNMIARVWWAQYDGTDTYNKVLQGKDANGNYSTDSLKTQGKLSALNFASKLLAQDSGYTNPSSYNQSFTNAQVMFLDEQAFMMVTGDWVEREMSGNFESDSVNIAYMRIPVNSNIIKQCDTVTTEERLVETIAYVDGDTDTRPEYLSDSDLERIIEARALYSCEGNQHIAYIPAYSNMVEEAKDFFRFMLSKEGQEIMLQYSYGNMAPLNVDVTAFEYYASLSTLQKSKYDMLNSNIGLSLIGENYSHPMGYAGGVRDFYTSPTMETAFGVVKTSASYMTAKEYWEADYNLMAKDWEKMMTQAGVSN